MRYVLLNNVRFFSKQLLFILLALLYVTTVSTAPLLAISQKSLDAIRRGHPYYNPGCLSGGGSAAASAPAATGAGISGVDITSYSPQKGGDSVEGGYPSSRPGPDGQSLVRTLDDVNNKTAEYVTLAGNPEFYNKEYTIPTITYNDLSGNSVTLTNVRAVVHDTGGDFRTVPEGRFDIAIGKDYPDSILNSEPVNGKGKIELIPGANAAPAPAAPSGCCSASTIDIAGSTGPVDINFTLGPVDASNTEAGKTRRINLAKVLMADFQLNAYQAAGIVGNFMWESGGYHLPPDWNQGTTTGAPPSFQAGYGWAQWTGSRQVTFIDFAVENKLLPDKTTPATDAANYAYLKEELANGYENTIVKVKEVKVDNGGEESAVKAAVAAFEAEFERAGKPALEERNKAAIQLFKEMGGLGVDPTTADPAASGAPSCGGAAGNASIVGDVAFPLLTTKSGLSGKGMFSNGTTQTSEHPYTAYDILVDGGTPVVAFLEGKVVRLGEDKCPGRLVSIYNKPSGLIVSYLHLNFETDVQEGDDVALGQKIGTVGPADPNGCGTAHLHIDAAAVNEGERRPGCKRESCPPESKNKFKDIGPELFKTFEQLPE